MRESRDMMWSRSDMVALFSGVFFGRRRFLQQVEVWPWQELLAEMFGKA